MQSWRIVAFFLMLLTVTTNGAHGETHLKIKNGGDDYDVGVTLQYIFENTGYSSIILPICSWQYPKLYRRSCWLSKTETDVHLLHDKYSEIKLEVLIRPLSNTKLFPYKVLEEFYPVPTNRCLEFLGNSKKPFWVTMHC